MERQPDGIMGNRIHAVPAVCRNPEEVPGAKLNRAGSPEIQTCLAPSQQDPFLSGLIVPEVRGACRSTGVNPLQPEGPSGEEFLKGLPSVLRPGGSQQTADLGQVHAAWSELTSA